MRATPLQTFLIALCVVIIVLLLAVLAAILDTRSKVISLKEQADGYEMAFKDMSKEFTALNTTLDQWELE